MKKIKFIIIVLVLILTLALYSCKDEEASVKVKFNDTIKEELIYPGSYDLTELVETLSGLKPTKEGYSFGGWYIDKACTTAFDPSTYTGTEALLNVYAKWVELRKIETYNGTSVLDTYYYDDLVKGSANLVSPTKTNYEFIGWTTDSEGTTAFDIKTYEYPSDKTTVKIFAQFKLIVNISFMNGNSLVVKENLDELKSGEATAPTVSKDGFNFGGWYLDESYTTEFKIDSFVGKENNVKVYAKWNAKPEVIYYDGETLLKKFYLEDAANNTVSDPTKTGYKFVGWVDSNGQAFSINNDANENQVAYAKWEQLVTVNFYNGSTLVAIKYLEELTAETLPTATKDTYTFVNWCTDTQLTTVFDYATFKTQAKTVNVYAKFIRNTVIQFMNGNELVAERTLSGLKNETLTSPTVSKNGYIFKNWTTDEEGQYLFNAKNLETEELNVKVYAQWTEKIKVSYYVDDTLYDSKVLDEITNAYVPTSPTKAGYEFIGWYTKAGQPFVLDVTCESSLTAVAKFEQKVKVYFYSGSDVIVTKYLDELTDATLPTATKDTYTFKGWYLDEEFTAQFVVTGYPTTIKTVNVYAKFEKITTVIFMSDTVEVARVLLSALKDGTSTAPVVTKAGYVFNQWLNGSDPFVASTLVTDQGTITVVADWTEKAKVNYYVDNNVYDSKVLDDITNAYVPTSPTKTGYDFIGWFDSNDNAFVLDVTSETNLTAIAKFEQKVTVNFYNGTTLVVSKYLDELTDSTLPTATKDTYTFKGWYLDEEYNNAFVVSGYPTTIKTVNVYAKFEKITTVIFMNGTEEVGRVLLSALKDGTSTAPTATKYGYTFTNWMYNESAFVANSVTTDDATITVTASFTEKAKVIFMVDGSVYETKYLFDLADNYAPTTPTKNGFFFGYWQDAENAEFDLADLDKNASENITLTAKWYNNPTVEGLDSNTTGTTITISWTLVNDYSYQVKVDNGDYADVESNSFVLPSATACGKHTITVKAIYRGHEATASIEVTQLVDFSLTNVTFDKNTREVTWDALENATKYDYKFNNAANWTTVYDNKFVVGEDVKAGTYNLTVTAYVTVNDTVIGSFEPKSTTVAVESVERILSNGLFMNENDEYVLMVGVGYTFGSYTFPTADWYTLSENNTKVTPNAGIAGNVYELETTTGEKINVCIENLVYSISSGINYAYYQYSKNDEFSETNKTGFKDVTRLYEVGTDDNSFVIDIDVDGSANYATDYIFDITGKVGTDTDVTRYLSLVANDTKHVYEIAWTSAGQALAEGTVIELTLVEHYSTKTQRETVVPSYTFKFAVNHGVNAYDFADLKAKVENTSITKVNMHQQITVTPSMVPTYSQYDESNPDAHNKDYYSLIVRNDNGTHEFELNGNYFEIDVSQLPLTKSQEQSAGPGYTVYWQRQAVIFLNGGTGAQSTITTTQGDYKVTETKDCTVANLRIKGNAVLGMSQTIVNQGSTAVAAELLRQSGAIDGIIMGGYNSIFDNVVIHHCTEGTKIQTLNGMNSTTQEMIYRKNNKHLFNKCSIGDNWANATYIWSDGLVEYRDSYIYDMSGVALIIGDNYSPTLTANVRNDDGTLVEASAGVYQRAQTTRAEEYVDDNNDIFLCNYPEILLNNTKVDNWKVGSEEYFTAYGMVSAIAGYKTAMESTISSATNSQYSLINTDENSFTYVNMVIQANAETALHSFNVGVSRADGTIAWSEERSQQLAANTYMPSHPMATASSSYQVLYPISSYSTASAYNTLLAAFTDEYTAYCYYYAGAYTYEQASALMPNMISAFGATAIQNKTIVADANYASSIGMQYMYLNAFNDAYANKTANGEIYMQVTVPNLNGDYSKYPATIIVSAYKTN